jgi:hypothetical protein
MPRSDGRIAEIEDREDGNGSSPTLALWCLFRIRTRSRGIPARTEDGVREVARVGRCSSGSDVGVGIFNVAPLRLQIALFCEFIVLLDVALQALELAAVVRSRRIGVLVVWRGRSAALRIDLWIELAVLSRREKDLVIVVCVCILPGGVLWQRGQHVVALGYASVLERRAVEGEMGVGQGQLGASYTLRRID